MSIWESDYDSVPHLSRHLQVIKPGDRGILWLTAGPAASHESGGGRDFRFRTSIHLRLLLRLAPHMQESWHTMPDSRWHNLPCSSTHNVIMPVMCCSFKKELKKRKIADDLYAVSGRLPPPVLTLK